LGFPQICLSRAVVKPHHGMVIRCGCVFDNDTHTAPNCY
jgi:hypothetical protein